MRAATEGSLPPVMPQGNLVEVLGREVRQGSPGELMVESTPSRQRRPPCKTNNEKSDEAADAAALPYLLSRVRRCTSLGRPSSGAGSRGSATRVSRVRLVRAWGPCTGLTACALAGRRCALWGWRKGVPGGGYLPPL